MSNLKERLGSQIKSLKKAVIPIGMSAALAFTACGGENVNTPTTDSSPKDEELNGSEKIKETIFFDFGHDENTGRLEVIITETETSFDFDPQAFQNIINIIASRGGRLPPYSRVILADTRILSKDPSAFGHTDGLQKIVRLSIKDGLSHNPFPRDKYTNEAVLNGVLVGEMTNLMTDEAGSLPAGAGHIERLGDNAGIMASAIFAKRSYQEYKSDTDRVTYLGSGGTIVFDEKTYRDFQQALKQPALRFRK